MSMQTPNKRLHAVFSLHTKPIIQIKFTISFLSNSNPQAKGIERALVELCSDGKLLPWRQTCVSKKVRFEHWIEKIIWVKAYLVRRVTLKNGFTLPFFSSVDFSPYGLLLVALASCRAGSSQYDLPGRVLAPYGRFHSTEDRIWNLPRTSGLDATQ